MKKKLVTEDFSGVAIMLTITIFATIVSDMLPVSNNTPLIGSINKRISTSLCFFFLQVKIPQLNTFLFLVGINGIF